MIVAHWPLRSNANDIGPNKLNGTAYDITYSWGKIGNAANFNNSSSYIEVAHSSLLSPPSLSVAGWIKVSDSGNWMMVNKGTGGSSGVYYLYGDSNTSTSWTIFASNGTRHDASAGTLTVGRWHHLVATFEASTGKMTTYKDGVLVSTTTGASLGTSSANLLIGKYTSGYHTNGQINDVRIYDHALSAKEAYDLSRSRVAHYRMGDPLEEASQNIIGNGDFSAGANTTQFLAANSYGTYSVISFPNNPGTSSYVLRQRGGEYEMVITGLSAATTYTLSCWVAYTSDWNGDDIIFHSRAFGTPSNTEIYTAGTEVESRTIDGLVWSRRYATITTPSSTVTSFSWYLGYSGVMATVGFRYYTQIQMEKKSLPTPFMLSSRNQGLSDISGITNTATIASSDLSPVFSSTKKVGTGSMDFNGSSHYAQMPNEILSTETLRSEGITVMAWVRPDVVDVSQRIGGLRISAGYSDIPSGGIGINSSGKALAICYDDNIAYKYSTSDTTLVAGNWYHIACVFTPTTNPAGTLQVYVNGVADGSSASITTFSRLSSTYGTHQSNRIGMIEHTTPMYFNGLISDFRVYSSPLSSSDIQSVYSVRASFDNAGNVNVYELDEENYASPGRVESAGRAVYSEFDEIQSLSSGLRQQVESDGSLVIDGEFTEVE
jgi:hypothetical protein